MSLRKIIFLIIIGITLLWIIIGITLLWSKSEKKVEIPKEITIWITDGSTEWYTDIIAWFKTFAPEYKNTKINIEKKISDPIRYRTILLSTLTDGTGPDIFMLNSWDDKVLEWKREPIPESILPIANFEKENEEIFQGLLTGSSDKEGNWTFLMWVPLWYETLGIFYNKWLLRSIPKTWDEVESLYSQDLGSGRYPTNLGLWPRYTPNALDVIAGFSTEDFPWYKTLWSSNGILASYLGFRNLNMKVQEWTEEDIYSPLKSSSTLMSDLEKDKKTTFDLFMQWDIAMIVGFPSTVLELEKSTKRSWINSIENLVYTANAPSNSLNWKKRNIARYTYLSISKLAKNPIAAAKFLEYLMTDEWTRKIQEAYPYIIPPKPNLYEAWKNKTLSKVLSKTKLDSFIPDINTKLSVFDYWLKAEFNTFLSENIDRNENIDISNIETRLVSQIDCTIGLYLWSDSNTDCEKKE